MERVNAYFGHKMIDDVRIVQGVISAPAAATPRRRDPVADVKKWPAAPRRRPCRIRSCARR